MTFTPTDLRDLGLGIVSIFVLGWIIVQLMKWQLEERREWTAKVEEWGKQQAVDKDRVIAVIERTAIVMQAFLDQTTGMTRDRESSKAAMTKSVEDICDNLRHNTAVLTLVLSEVKAHRGMTEAGQPHGTRKAATP